MGENVHVLMEMSSGKLVVQKEGEITAGGFSWPSVQMGWPRIGGHSVGPDLCP